MTEAVHATLPDAAAEIDHATVVLLNRKVRPGTDQARLSRFGDDRWDLTPAIFEQHTPGVSINFTLMSPAWRQIAKTYMWLELNHDRELLILRRSNVAGRLAIPTLVAQFRHLRTLLEWLDSQAITSISAVTGDDLDRYLQAVRDAEMSHGGRADLLQAVRRLWAFRELLPEHGRLPVAPPWRGKDSRVLLGRAQRDLENKTPRIPETTMSPMLGWALRFVEDFSDDVLTALQEYRPLLGITRRRPKLPGDVRGTDWLMNQINALLCDFRDRDEPLPGRVLADGSREPSWPHLGRLLNINYMKFQRPGRYRDAVLQFCQDRTAEGKIPVADAAYLRHRPTGVLDGKPWLERIRYEEVPKLVALLHTACLIVITYLSGMRPGEALNLERGCASRDPRTGLWQLSGRKWKGAVDAQGVKIPEGLHRDDPWIVVEPVAKAVAVAERMHDQQVLFPVTVFVAREDNRRGSRASSIANVHLNEFLLWANDFCRSRGRADMITVPESPLALSQLRRTLAWFICRRPRGLVAAAIQYNHVNVQITQGYGGNYASGFPDDLAFERWLTRLDDLAEADRRLRDGEHVSGPAADAYRSRVTGGSAHFAGRVLRSGRQARAVLANPSLQIHEGKGMTCVFNAESALCELTPSTDDARHTPDTTDCRPNCRNIARTDRDIAELRAEAAELRATVDDLASPPIRLARERHRLLRLDAIIAEHEATTPGEATA